MGMPPIMNHTTSPHLLVHVLLLLLLSLLLIVCLRYDNGQDKRDFHGIKEALADLLITPVQRIPRYSLLLEVCFHVLSFTAWLGCTTLCSQHCILFFACTLQQILKYTSPSSQDFRLLRDALEKIKRVAEMINECKRAAQIVEDIEARLAGCPEVTMQSIVTLLSALKLFVGLLRTCSQLFF